MTMGEVISVSRFPSTIQWTPEFADARSYVDAAFADLERNRREMDAEQARFRAHPPSPREGKIAS